ncbi:response regulator receiver modulated diguanylate cyclase [Cyanobacterium stanieri PCC 7202]|uniref:Response regulator receiver modulated diguanylate cyclase n=1 Tax=Cyanobacterium stanieri (strain ATCC 29140 / PCC 7202) TaxID=292563 RepID=K9YIK9_CYASC|nr:response regulator receiver modulated diguanylate cyclase [Cyanobacterium stanieri PCC 7202]
MKKSIIILDNLEEQINFFRDLIKDSTHSFVDVDNELDLLDFVQVKAPDLILISSAIPDLDCHLVCKKIKLLEKGKNIPVIIINRDPRYFNVDLIFDAGANDYINYPFNKREVIHRLNQQLLIKTLKDNLRETTTQLHKIIPHYQRLQELVETSNLPVTNQDNEGRLHLIPNRRYFEEMLQKEWLRASRQRNSLSDMEGTDLSIILAKINDFEAYENNHEKEIVDSCLRIITQDVKDTAKRAGDLVAEFDKDTFAVLLPSTNTAGAQRVAQVIGNHVMELQIPHHFSSVSEFITFSFGLATGIPTQAIHSSNLIDVAQDCLQRAIASKQSNAVVTDQF